MRLSGLLLLSLLLIFGCSGTDDASLSGAAATPRLILVTGATGTQGGAVARELLSRGFAVRALTRSPEKPAARALADLGADIVQGSYDDADALAAAMQGVWGAFLLTDWWEHGVEREVEHGRILVDAAKAAQVKHVVFTSVANADRDTGVPHFDSKYEIEQYLRHSELDYSIIRPVSFMNNWLWRKAEFLSGEIREPYDPDTRHQWIAARDIGFFAGEAFAKAEQWRGRAIDIAGDAMTLRELSAVLSEVSGRPVEYQRMTWGEYARDNNDQALKMAQWFDGVGYSVDVAALREQYPNLMSARDFLAELDWSGEPND